MPIPHATKVIFLRALALCCALACAAVFGLFFVQSAGSAHTQDRNRDGQPDVWQLYDARGKLVEAATDTNFDGRWDREELYADGHLFQRRSDRNFDERVDLVEYFDADSHDHVRSIVDVGFDGRADLLVLFRSGRAVYSEWSVAGAADAVRHDGRSLRGLADPFASHTALRSFAIRASSDSASAAFLPGGITAHRMDAAGSVSENYAPSTLINADARSAASLPASPRGPPHSVLF